MKKRKNVFRPKLFFVAALAVCLSVGSFPAQAQHVGAGKWRTHFAQGEIFKMVKQDAFVYGASRKTLYRTDTRDRTMTPFGKVEGLSGVDISAMAYNPDHEVLIVGYADGYVDLVYGSDVLPIDDIYDKDLGTGKKVNAIYTEGRYAYLAMDFGVVVLDLRKGEIKETYQTINQQGSYDAVLEVLILRDRFYLLQESCVKTAPVNAPNLNDYSVWETDTCMEEGKSLAMKPLWGGVMIKRDTGLLWGDAQRGWRPLSFSAENARPLFVDADGEHLFLGWLDTLTWKRWVEVWTDTDTRMYSTEELSIYTPSAAMVDEEGRLWTATAGAFILINMQKNMVETTYYCRRTPLFDAPYSVSCSRDKVLACIGGYSRIYAPVGNRFQFSYLYDDEWNNYEAVSYTPPIPAYSPAFAVEDPQVPFRFYVASAISGLVKLEKDSYTLYNPDNSPLEWNNVLHGDCRLTGLAFDASGDLWIVNNLADKSLHVLHRNGDWHSYDLRTLGYDVSRVGTLLVDYWQHKWVTFDHSKVAVLETDGSSIKGLTVDMNYGNDLKTEKVWCIVEDQLGHLWFGTDRGVKIIDQHARMFESPRGTYTSVPVKTVKVPVDGYLMELLKDDQVMAIAVDGANRKWLGTGENGLFLVSADGMEELEHFTTDNSPLLSNSVSDLAIDNRTGELFITNELGLISYRGTATYTQDFDKKEVKAYPNPVRPGYEGLISIKGLPNNALVKITDTKGNLIYQAKATGGQLSWNGYSMQGKKPDSGVLFVYAAGDDKSERVVCKIFYVR